MEEKKKGTIARLLDFAGDRAGLTYVGCALSAVAMAINMVPYVCIWLVIRDLVAVAPNWGEATRIASYGWAAFGFAVAGIVVYFFALMCTHLAAFRTATNIRKRCMAHLAKAPLGYFDTHASGLLRRRIDGAAAQTETLLAHNLADITGTVAMFVTLLALLLVFDWRMGLACLMAAVISIGALFTMMGGKNAGLMAQYYDALDNASKAGTEYVRGIPVVKVFQQTVYSFRAFKEAIDAYSERASYYQGTVCKTPQSVNLTFTEGAFALLIPVALLIAPEALASGDFAGFVTNFAFYAVFSAVLSTALAKIMFAAGGLTQAGDALKRIEEVLSAPTLPVAANPQIPVENSVTFEDVSFTYEGAELPALDHVSFSVPAGETIALVGPSGGGKTTAASLVPRFWDVDAGAVRVGGVDVRDIDPHVLMDRVAFVFQNTRLFSTSILENVRAARPDATREQVLEALHDAQCDDIIEKLPDGVDTMIGSAGTYLSGGEQQRVALARAILKDAPIVVLDEATAFADPENEVLIQKAFARLLRGRTVIMIAHRLSTVVNADRIVVLDRGHVVEQGSHTELVSKDGLYARMWADYQTAAQWKIEKEVA
ncbi:MAG: ABC transporter ATP-binding protein [Atopobiaceae bacterium]|nr:ABC transporter ATP-binding protein [Atopobiaceae bacterium]